MISWSYDMTVDASYVRVGDGSPDHQVVRCGGAVVLDLDEHEQLVGVEMIGVVSLDALQGIVAEFRVPDFAAGFLQAVGLATKPAAAGVERLELVSA